jgi:hypothetical protein
LINGKMRTPKIEALFRLIQWFNNKQTINIKNISKLKVEKIDISPIESNAWLSGFLDADGNFYSQIGLNSKGIVNNIKYYMRISLLLPSNPLTLLPSNPLSCPLASSEERGEEARGQDRGGA